MSTLLSRPSDSQYVDFNTLVWPPATRSPPYKPRYIQDRHHDQLPPTRPLYHEGSGFNTSRTPTRQPLQSSHHHHPTIMHDYPSRSSSPCIELSPPPPRIRRTPRFKFDDSSSQPNSNARKSRPFREIRPPTPAYAILPINRRRETPPPPPSESSSSSSNGNEPRYLPDLPIDPLPYLHTYTDTLEMGRGRSQSTKPNYSTQGWLDVDAFRRSKSSSRTPYTSSPPPGVFVNGSSNHTNPSPLHYRVPSTSSYSSRSHSSSAASPLLTPSGPLPTRLGFWNRRGDTLIPETGHIRPAPRSQLFPPDLSHYPRYALMNQNGELMLPVREEERVDVWRSYLEVD